MKDPAKEQAFEQLCRCNCITHSLIIYNRKILTINILNYLRTTSLIKVIQIKSFNTFQEKQQKTDIQQKDNYYSTVKKLRTSLSQKCDHSQQATNVSGYELVPSCATQKLLGTIKTRIYTNNVNKAVFECSYKQRPTSPNYQIINGSKQYYSKQHLPKRKLNRKSPISLIYRSNQQRDLSNSSTIKKKGRSINYQKQLVKSNQIKKDNSIKSAEGKSIDLLISKMNLLNNSYGNQQYSLESFKDILTELNNLVASFPTHQALINQFKQLYLLPFKNSELSYQQFAEKLVSLMQIIQNTTPEQEIVQMTSPNEVLEQTETMLTTLKNENIHLKKKLRRIHNKVNENRQNDECVMKLLNALKQQGIDIEKVFNENVRTPSSKHESVCEDQINSVIIQELMKSSWFEELSDEAQFNILLQIKKVTGNQV